MMTPMDENESRAAASMGNFPNWMAGYTPTSTNGDAEEEESNGRHGTATGVEDGRFTIDDDDGGDDDVVRRRHHDGDGDDAFRDEGVVTTRTTTPTRASAAAAAGASSPGRHSYYGQGHRHGATVYDDWGLPISNPHNFHEGRNVCRPWLVAMNIVAVGLVVGIILHGGPSTNYAWYGFSHSVDMDPPTTDWEILGNPLVGPIIPRQREDHKSSSSSQEQEQQQHDDLYTENQFVGFGHHVAMNEKGDRVAVGRTITTNDDNTNNAALGEIYVYYCNIDGDDGATTTTTTKKKKTDSNKWRLEKVLTAQLTPSDVDKTTTTTITGHQHQQHTPLAMSALGHRIAFTEGDVVFIFESDKPGVEWKQIDKLQSRDHANIGDDAPDQENNTDNEEEEGEENSSSQLTTVPEQQQSVEADEKEGDTEKEDEEGGGEKRDEEEGGGEDEEGEGEDEEGGGDEVGEGEEGDEQGGEEEEDGEGEEEVEGTPIREEGEEENDNNNDNDNGGDGPGNGRALAGQTELERSGDHFGKHLAFSRDGRTLAVMGFSRDNGGYIRVFQDETEEDNQGNHYDMFEPTPDIFLEELGDSLAMSGDGHKIAVGISTSDAHNGIVQVYAISDYTDQWSRIGQPIFGEYAREGFGGSVSLSDDGNALAVGVAYGGGPVIVYEIAEEDQLRQEWHWIQRGQTLHGMNTREHFGAQVRLNNDGTIVAVGAPGSPDLLELNDPIDDEMKDYLYGKAFLFQYNKGAHRWDYSGNATSAYAGDAFGYSLDLSGTGDRVIVGAPFRIVHDQVDVGVVQIFGTLD